jgi:hypothetical protein
VTPLLNAYVALMLSPAIAPRVSVPARASARVMSRPLVITRAEHHWASPAK